MPLFSLENVVRLQPRERYLLQGTCWLSAALGIAWMALALNGLIARRGSLDPVSGILAFWLVAFVLLTVPSVLLARNASKPIRTIAEQVRRVLLVIFSIRLMEGLFYTSQGDLLYTVYIFLALLGLWTAWSMIGVEEVGLLRLTVLGAVFGFVMAMFLFLGAGNAITGLQSWWSVFWTVSPQIALTLPHLLFVWGAYRYKHILMTAAPEDDSFAA